MLASEEQFANFAAQVEGAGMKSIKRFVIGLVGLSTLYGAPAQAEKWLYVTDSGVEEDKITYYIDTDSLEELSNGDIRIFEKKEQEGWENIIFQQYEYNCTKMTKSLVHWEMFQGDRPVEVYTWEDPWSQRYENIVTGSISDKMLKAACALDPLPQ